MLEIVRLDDTEADWDSLVFIVQWPITTCNTWKERKPTHTCILPTDKMSNDEQHWPVHGVWSIRTGSFEGPFFCNRTWEFNPDNSSNHGLIYMELILKIHFGR